MASSMLDIFNYANSSSNGNGNGSNNNNKSSGGELVKERRDRDHIYSSTNSAVGGASSSSLSSSPSSSQMPTKTILINSKKKHSYDHHHHQNVTTDLFKSIHRPAAFSSSAANSGSQQPTRLQRPIAPSTPPPPLLLATPHSPTSAVTINQIASNNNNKIRVRLLVFVEDPSATRTNIFDSAKHQQQQPPPPTMMATVVNGRKLSRSSMHGKLNGLSIGENVQSTTTASSSYTATTSNLNSSRASTSSTINNNNNNNITKLNNEMILRMVFGSYPMHVSDRTAIKVHSLTNSNKAMISNVFNYYKNSPNKTQCYCKPSTPPVHQFQQINTTASTATMIHDHDDPPQSNSPHVVTSSSVRSSTAIPIKQQQQPSSSSSSVLISVSNHGSLMTSSSLLSNTNNNIKINNHHHHHHKLNSDYSSTSSSFNSNSNLNVNINKSGGQAVAAAAAAASGGGAHHHHALLNTSVNLFGSSVPTSSTLATNGGGGSYMGVYKRFMRSISNSLISSNSNLTTVDTVGGGGTASDLAGSCGSGGGGRCLTADVVNSDHEFDATNTHNDSRSTTNNNNNVLVDSSERVSLSGMSNNGGSGYPSYLCEKCLENNLYPKYKIGVAIIFSLPSPVESQQANEMSSQSPSSSGCNLDSTGGGYLSSRSNSIRIDETMMMSSPPLPFDPLLLFPANTTSSSSSSNSPTSPPNSPPPHTSSLLLNTSRSETSKQPTTTPPNHRPTVSDEFYEFLFTHLPIIEYQFKELRDKVIAHLPNHFNSPRFNSTSHRHSITSQTSNGLNYNKHIPSSSTHSSISSLLSSATATAASSPTNTNTNYMGMSFSRLLMHEQELFEKRFNLLYYSPRLTSPAWLSLMMSQSKIKPTHGRRATAIDTDNSAASTIANNLIKDLLYLSRPRVNSMNGGSESKSPTNTSSFIGGTPPRTPTDSAGYLSSIYQKFFKTSNSSSNINNNNSASQTTEPIHFLSTILSSILKYHLSWVYTVLPSNEIGGDHRSSSGNRLRKQRAYWTRLLEKTNPYNPLWAQLGDLHGAVNQPLRLVRTVVVGQNRQLVERILFLLSYFIRCGNSSYFDLVQESFDFDQLVESIGEEELSTSSLNQSGSSETANNVSEAKAASIVNREIDIITAESKPDDPFAQLSIILGRSASIQQDLVNQSEVVGNNTTTISVKTTTTTDSSSSNLSSPYSTLPSHGHGSGSTTNNNNNRGKKKRLLSSSSNGVNCSARELPLIGCKLKPNHHKSTRMQDNFGYSLLAAYCDEFCFEFVLHGTSDRSFLNDLQQRVTFSKNNSILDSQIDESVYIVVDVDQFEVKVFSSSDDDPCVKEKPVSLVNEMLTSLLDMTKLFQNSDFVLLHLEDKLQEFYTKSLTLGQLKSQSVEMDDQTLMHLMDFDDPADLDFLKRILSTVTLPNMTVLAANNNNN